MPLIAEDGKVYFQNLDDNSKNLVASTEAEFIKRGYAGAYGTTWKQLTGGSSQPTRPTSNALTTDDWGDFSLQNGGNAGAAQPITGNNTTVGNIDMGETDAAAEDTASIAGTDKPKVTGTDEPKVTGTEITSTTNTSKNLNTISQFRDGDIESIIAQYEQDLQEDIPLPAISVNGVMTELVQGNNAVGNSGWGYYTEDPINPGYTIFVITQESAKAGLLYERLQADLLRKENFITNYRRAESDDARQKAANEELSRLTSQLRMKEGERDAEAAIEAIQEQARQNLEAQRRSQQFNRGERIAGQEFAEEQRIAAQVFQRGESDLARTFQAEQRELGESFATQERLGSEEFAAKSREDAQRFAEEERLASEEFASSQRIQTQAFQSAQALLGREFTTEEREASQAFAEAMQEVQFEENRAVREKEQTFQKEQAEEAREAEAERQRIQNEFQETQNRLNREQQAALESARLGIADATSEEGIAEAVKRAEEARRLERAQTIVRLVQDLANDPAVVRGLRQSGILQAMGEELGVDFSFITGGGGLATGSTGTPVRITA